MTLNRIFPRSSWTVSKTPRPRVSEPMDVLYIHHTVMVLRDGDRATRAQEEAYWRAVRAVHLARGYPDIAYCFGVTPAGRLYELIGFGREGIHTCHHNDQLAIVAAGNFEETRPSIAMRHAIVDFAVIAVRKDHLKRDFVLRGHRDVGACSGATACPGIKLYEFIGWIREEVRDRLHPNHHHQHKDPPHDEADDGHHHRHDHPHPRGAHRHHHPHVHG